MISAEEAIRRLKEGNAQYVSTDTFKADISSALLELKVIGAIYRIEDGTVEFGV